MAAEFSKALKIKMYKNNNSYSSLILAWNIGCLFEGRRQITRVWKEKEVSKKRDEASGEVRVGGCEVVDSLHLVSDTKQWWAVVNTVMNHGVP
jgi:hypothetical protein